MARESVFRESTDIGGVCCFSSIFGLGSVVGALVLEISFFQILFSFFWNIKSYQLVLSLRLNAHQNDVQSGCVRCSGCYYRIYAEEPRLFIEGTHSFVAQPYCFVELTGS